MKQQLYNQHERELLAKSLLNKLNPNDGVEQICEVLSTVYGGQASDYQNNVKHAKLDAFERKIYKPFAEAFGMSEGEADGTLGYMFEILDPYFSNLVDELPVTAKDILRLWYKE